MRSLRLICISSLLILSTHPSHGELGSSQRTASKRTYRVRNSDVKRAKRALRKLQKSSKCSKLAKSHANTLAQKEFKIGSGKSHFSFPDRVKSYKIKGGAAEINASTENGNFENALRAWLKYDTHRKQLFSKRNKKVGVARAKSRNGKYYWVMCFELY